MSQCFSGLAPGVRRYAVLTASRYSMVASSSTLLCSSVTSRRLLLGRLTRGSCLLLRLDARRHRRLVPLRKEEGEAPPCAVSLRSMRRLEGADGIPAPEPRSGLVLAARHLLFRRARREQRRHLVH